jgi:hypothetical protein
MKLGILAIALMLTGCDWNEKGEMKEAVPLGWKQFVTPGNHITYVVPVEVNGVSCVVVSANGDGRGVSCDWREK